VIEELHQLVRTDSIASIETEGLVGGSFLSISAGSAGAPQAAPLSTLAGQEPFELADLLQQMNATVMKVNTTIDEMRGEVEDTIIGVRETVQRTNDLVASISGDVQTMASSGARVTADIASMTTSVREGQGTLGKLFTDDELYGHMNRVVANAEAMTTDAKAVIAQARETLTGLQGAEGPVVNLAGNLRQTLDDARSAMSGFAENMDALRHNFLLRGFFNSRGYFNLEQISPAEYRAGALAGGGRTAVRVWLGSDRVFEPDDGEKPLRLSNDGRRRLDAAIAPYLDRVADGVLMIEGLATQGGRDQQFLVSRARAVTVRDYLIERFHLEPRSTGVMPLGSEPSPGAPATPWEGVTLTFFLQSK
jgi:phospholipid/cholesterol/gamma-HCH transport system substrate-binding protein